MERFRTGNSRTQLAYDTNWYVLDIGSGHNPHPRASVLVDKFLLDDYERAGAAIKLPTNTPFVIADACTLPFKDGAFDFIICSHVAEHVENVGAFCSELNRVARGGYLETPGKFAEVLRHHPHHRWYVSLRRGVLTFEPAPNGHPLGWFGKLFYSLYLYRSPQAKERDVFTFAYGCPKPWHYIFVLVRESIFRLWRIFKPITYTRLVWENSFSWQVKLTRRCPKK